MKTHSRTVLSGFVALFASVVWIDVCPAQNTDYPGYLGVYVVEGNAGMQITGFIRETPAESLADDGEISRGDTILRVGGRTTSTHRQLLDARNRIPVDKEAKMILRDRRGGTYYVWISRNPAAAAYGRAAADAFRAGGRGTGDEGDFRDRPGAGEGDSENEGDFRDKR